MQNQNPLGDIVFMVALILFASVLVDERWIRVAIALVPALLLAQRAWAVPLGTQGGDLLPTPDRRTDDEVRGYIDDLLRHIRDFYTTAHLMASGKLEPAEAKELAAAIERRLNTLLAKIQSREGDEGPTRAQE